MYITLPSHRVTAISNPTGSYISYLYEGSNSSSLRGEAIDGIEDVYVVDEPVLLIFFIFIFVFIA
ncbi:MAG: hypothetical protein AB8U16_00850 [Rickettsiales endosymbiont of Dermacentor nuttalli]